MIYVLCRRLSPCSSCSRSSRWVCIWAQVVPSSGNSLWLQQGTWFSSDFNTVCSSGPGWGHPDSLLKTFCFSQASYSTKIVILSIVLESEFKMSFHIFTNGKTNGWWAHRVGWRQTAGEHTGYRLKCMCLASWRKTRTLGKSKLAFSRGHMAFVSSWQCWCFYTPRSPLKLLTLSISPEAPQSLSFPLSFAAQDCTWCLEHVR